MRATRMWMIGVALGLLTVCARGEELQWRPASGSRPQADVSPRPIASLGRPELIAEAPEDQPPAFDPLRPIIRCQAPGVPPGAVPAVPPPPPPPPFPGGGPGSGDDAFNCGVVVQPPGAAHPILNGARDATQGVAGVFGGFFGRTDGGCLFQSDQHFKEFSSPVTNPLYFMDPRALTEVRPIYIYQKTPGANYLFGGGPINFFALQGRVAFTDRLSLVVSELGVISEDLDGSPQPSPAGGTGFAEVHLGPQFTFIRNDCTGTLLAGGLTFEIPTGPDKVAQNTGTLSLVPYLSFGQEFGKMLYGSFHFLNTTGYSVSVNQQRTDFFFSSFHLDFDVVNGHKFYPFVEMNWFVYTKDGAERPFPFEGRDLINFGSTMVAGKNDLSVAVGTRYKICEPIQLGAGVEFPLLPNKQLMNIRLTFDAIFRY